MSIQTREDFIEYCLRKLGKPVINIEIDTTQANDRVDEALQVYREKHYDASENVWVYYKCTEDDVDKGYIKMDDSIHVVYKISVLNQFVNTSSGGMFSPQYQILSYEFNNWQPFDSVDYYIKMLGIQESASMIGGGVGSGIRFEFNKHSKRLKVFSPWDKGTEFVMKVFKCFPEDEVWNDKWLKLYTTALLKRQWGENISKFADVQLLGGVTLRADRLIDEATREIEQLEEQLKNEHMEPVDFIVG